MSKNYYTVITGAKDNAGDFLIKLRATQLLTKLRPDRELVHFDSWDSLVDEKLSVVNNSKAVLLAGGPSVQTKMYPEIYKLSSSIDQIKVPIICFGVGSKHHNFNEFGWRILGVFRKPSFRSTYNYTFDLQTQPRIKKG